MHTDVFINEKDLFCFWKQYQIYYIKDHAYYPRSNQYPKSQCTKRNDLFLTLCSGIAIFNLYLQNIKLYRNTHTTLVLVTVLL